MRVLITGAEGFTGRFVAEQFKSSGGEIHGLMNKQQSQPWVDCVYQADLLDQRRVDEVVDVVRPDLVIHLAAIAFVAHGDVEAIYRTNIIGTRNLLQALVSSGTCPKGVLLASSANIYGNADVDIIDENVPASPANDYAVSKLAMEYMARLYMDRLPITIVRPFNYTGVGQSLSFLLPKIVDHFRRRAPVIELGNLEVARDFSDVRMVAECYRRLLERNDVAGTAFNVCSGRVYTLAEIIQLAEKISAHKIEVHINPAFVRNNEVRVLRGSRNRLEAAIGDIADIPLEETLRWMLMETDS